MCRLFLSLFETKKGRGDAYILTRKRTLALHVFFRLYRTRADQEHSHRLGARNTDRPSRVSGARSLAPPQHIRAGPLWFLTGRETPRTSRTAARGHASRLNCRARRTRRRVGAVARRMGPAEKGVLQVRAISV